MKRIVVMGRIGSGKSYLSKMLEKELKIPVIHLDKLYWNNESFIKDQKKWLFYINSITKNETWIIDGNFHKTLYDRIKFADTIIYVDVPVWQSIISVFFRAFCNCFNSNNKFGNRLLNINAIKRVFSYDKIFKNEYYKLLNELKNKKQIFIVRKRINNFKELSKYKLNE